MSVAGHLNRGRARHQLLMLDTVTIIRPDLADTTWNPATQTYTTAQTPVYTGPCRVVTWRANEEEAAETEVAVIRYRLDLPLTDAAPRILRRDIATITASFNPVLVGLTVVITEPEFATTATALRIVGEVAQ